MYHKILLGNYIFFKVFFFGKKLEKFHILMEDSSLYGACFYFIGVTKILIQGQILSNLSIVIKYLCPWVSLQEGGLGNPGHIYLSFCGRRCHIPRIST